MLAASCSAIKGGQSGVLLPRKVQCRRLHCTSPSNVQLGWTRSNLVGAGFEASAMSLVSSSRLSTGRRWNGPVQTPAAPQRTTVLVQAAAGASAKVRTRRGPRLKLIKRLGPLPGLTRKALKKPSGPRSTSASSSSSSRARPKKKPTQYGIRLLEKQKLLFNYGLKEGQLLRLVKEARRAKGSTGETLLQLLEMRLDNIVFRIGLAPTIPAARQLVSHGHIAINGKRVNIPSYRCRPTETVSVFEKERSKALVANNIANGSKRSKPPNHIAVSASGLSGTVNRAVSREAVGVKVNELFVVEYYSRMA